MNVLLSAGEVSGDIAGAGLARELARRVPDAGLWGLGGDRMREAGVELLAGTSHLGTVGVSEAFATLAPHARAFAAVRRAVRARRPGAAVLVANDIFHVLLGRWLRRNGVPTVSFFPPQVWIWRSLARPFSRSFDAVLACFPEEVAVWSAAGTRTAFVGHYLADTLAPPTDDERRAARAAVGIPAGREAIGLLPGSRTAELRVLAPLLFGAARRLLEEDRSRTFLVPPASASHREALEAEARAAGVLPAVRFVEESHAVMRAADILLLASGTASLEAALLGTPMVLAYRVRPLTLAVVRSAIALSLIDSDTVGLPNLVLGRPAVPELTQRRLTAEALAHEGGRLLADPAAREAQRAALLEVRGRLLGDGSFARAAEAVLSVARGRSAAEAPLAVGTVEWGPSR